MSTRARNASVGYLLDLEPDLATGVRPEEEDAARGAFVGPLISVAAGSWALDIPGDPATVIALGLMVVSGIVAREIRLHDRRLLELLGPGDQLTLPGPRDHTRLDRTTTLTAATDTLLLGLGEDMVRAAARFPGVLVGLRARSEDQRERFGVQALITHLSRADHRLLLMLWHLAERWGHMTAAGIVLPLPLSHDFLGQLTGARRSTATLALHTLEELGAVRRLEDGAWLLTQEAERHVKEIVATPAVGRPLGELLASRMRMAETARQAEALRAEARQLTRRPSGDGSR